MRSAPVRVDLTVSSDPLEVARLAGWAEASGFDTVWLPETNHDPLLAAGLAANATTTVRLGTAVAIAFARSPMTVALNAWDLQRLAQGRFTLGLGSQVKAHIERRFSMPWSHPARRMREYVSAVRAIWRSWLDDEPLHFQGDFYTHTLMAPPFVPPQSPHRPPAIFLAAVGPAMFAAAAEVADGVHLHPLVSERYLRQVVRPTVAKAAAQAGRDPADVELSVPVMVVSGRSEREMAVAADRVRRQIAFYASTPAYLPVLAVHGWTELQAQLQAITRRQAWAELPALVDDDVLRTFAVVGEPMVAADTITERYRELAGRVTLLDIGTATPVLADIAGRLR
jgi:probable F420-dependent oxidoreductase